MPDIAELQADALALTVATHHHDSDAIRVVLDPYMVGVPGPQAAKLASLLTMLASTLGQSLELIGSHEGVDFDTMTQVAGQLGAQRATAQASRSEHRCTVCGVRVTLYDPDDPESFVHAEDGDWDDHSAVSS